MGIACFWVEPTEEGYRSLRRYRRGSEERCPLVEGAYSYHNVSVRLPGLFSMVWAIDEEDGHKYVGELTPESYKGETAWPTHCACGYEFVQDDPWQYNQDLLYVACDGPNVGWRWTQRSLPAGAVWEAWWTGGWAGINGTDRVLMIKLPSGQEFMPGMEASNCTRKGENHDCWCVHGEPPALTINKDPLPGRSTCDAGGGSIDSAAGTPRAWHGFVTGGELVG